MLVANSQLMQGVLEQCKEIPKRGRPALLIGRRGTGRNALANYIYQISARPLIESVNCNDHPENIKRSLFGHFDHLRAETAFDPEDEAYFPGKVETAVDGILFLDRIDLLPRECVGIVHSLVLGKPFSPLNSNKLLHPTNIQFIASCDPSPLTDELDGHLHELIRSLFEIKIIIPDLRERSDDVIPLIKHFVYLGNPAIVLETIDLVANVFAEHSWIMNIYDIEFVSAALARLGADNGIISRSIAEEAMRELTGKRGQTREYARQARCMALGRNIVYQDKPIDGYKIYSWVRQFERFGTDEATDPKDIAESIIRIVAEKYYYDNQRLQGLLNVVFNRVVNRVFLKEIEQGTNSLQGVVRNSVLVPDFLGTMKSSSIIQSLLRTAVGLKPEKNSVRLEELAGRIEQKKQRLLVLIVDDFLGTGNQVQKIITDYLLNESIERAVKTKEVNAVEFVIMYCVAFEVGLTKLQDFLQSLPDWLHITVDIGVVCTPEDQAFHEKSTVFATEGRRKAAYKIAVERIGNRLFQKEGMGSGYGGVQSLVVFQHNIPNNSLPILWKNGFIEDQAWYPLFPRLGTV